MADESLKVDQDGKGGEMSVREAGKKGGDTVRNRYGSGFYEEIGRKGGQATRERHGAGFYESIGQKGGKVVKEKDVQPFGENPICGQKGKEQVPAQSRIT